MIHLRRRFCTAVQKQAAQPTTETHKKYPLKFISQLTVHDLKSEAYLKRLEQSIQHRKSPFPFEGLRRQYQLMQELQQQWNVLESKKKEVNQLYNKAETDQMKEKYKHDGITVREDIRRLREVLTSLKEDVNLLTQTMPNVLHERIPLEQPYLMSEWRPDESSRGLVTRDFNHQKFPHCTYSTGKHAWIDLMLPIKVVQQMRANGFVQTSNPDFIRRFVARAGGVQDGSYNTIHEEEAIDPEQQLHLIGGGAFASYLPYFTRFSTYPTALPLKLVTIGRQYDSYSSPSGTVPSQGQVVQFFIATKTAEDTNDAFDDVIELYENIYRKFGQAFRMSLAPAPALKNADCLRVDVAQESALSGEFEHVADIRYLGDYVSKRILFNYRVGKNYGLPHILTGTVVHVPRLLQNIDVDSFDLDNC